MGAYRNNSDIDLVISGNVNDILLGAIRRELDELPLPFLFDVVVYANIKHQELKDHIDRFGNIIYEKPIA